MSFFARIFVFIASIALGAEIASADSNFHHLNAAKDYKTNALLNGWKALVTVDETTPEWAVLKAKNFGRNPDWEEVLQRGVDFVVRHRIEHYEASKLDDGETAVARLNRIMERIGIDERDDMEGKMLRAFANQSKRLVYYGEIAGSARGDKDEGLFIAIVDFVNHELTILGGGEYFDGLTQ